MLITIPDVLNAEQLRDCRQALEQAQWEDGRTTAGYLAQSSKRNLQLPLDTTVARQMGEFLMLYWGSTVVSSPRRYRCVCCRRVLIAMRVEGEYGNHIDNAIFTVPGMAQRLRTDVSTTLFFSDPDEYEGGELIIEDVYGTQSIKLPAGHMVVYPGTKLGSSPTCHKRNPLRFLLLDAKHGAPCPSVQIARGSWTRAFSSWPNIMPMGRSCHA